MRPVPKSPRSPLLSTAEWIRALEPLGAQLTVEKCDCEETDELHHRLGHVLRMAAQMLDAADDGKIELSATDRRLMERA